MKQRAEISSGKNHEIKWNLDDSGRLTITGAGKLPDCACGVRPDSPWADVKDRILEIVIEDGITQIGINAFRDCSSLKRVTLPDSLWRIHSYAFWNCTQLEEIHSGRTDFKYVYDERPYQKSETVIFGVNAFYRVPWCRLRWGEFYIGEDALYICFSDGRKLELPEGLRTLKAFSLSGIEVDAVRLPNSLEAVENFAFSDFSSMEKLILPEGVQTIEPYAFAECDVAEISFPFSWKPERTQWKRAGMKKSRRTRMTEYINRYSLALVKEKGMGDFRRLRVVENQPIHHKNGTVTKVRDRRAIDIGKSIYRRIRNDKVVLCIAYENNRVISLKSFVWLKRYELAEEYLMYPVDIGGRRAGIWSDSFTYQEGEEIIDAFTDRNGEALKEAGLIRFRHPDTHEEWFWSKDRGNYGGPLELELLDLWLKKHPEITVDTMEDNREKGKYRWFVGI